MQHGVAAIRRSPGHARFVTPRPRSRTLVRPVRFRTLAGPAPALAGRDRLQPVVALRVAARRLGTIGALSVEQERAAIPGVRTMRWSPARVALRDGRRPSASPWRG